MSPFMMACKNVHMDVVEYLLHILPLDTDIIEWAVAFCYVDVVYMYVETTRVTLSKYQSRMVLKLAERVQHTHLLMLLHTVYDVEIDIVPRKDRGMPLSMIDVIVINF